MKPKILAVVCVSSLILAAAGAPPFANGGLFDGQRKGFILGGGIGGLYSSSGYGGAHQHGVFTSNFKIGYAPSNSFEVYFTSPLYLYSDDQTPFLTSVTGVGVTKYLRPEGTGFSLCGGIGVTSRWCIEKYSPHGMDHPFDGFGAFGGIGYDIGKHWCIQADVLYAGVDSGPEWGFRLTLERPGFLTQAPPASTSTTFRVTFRVGGVKRRHLIPFCSLARRRGPGGWRVLSR